MRFASTLRGPLRIALRISAQERVDKEVKMARKEKVCGVLAAAGNEKSLNAILLAVKDARSALQTAGPEIRIMHASTMAQVKQAAAGAGSPPGIMILGIPLRTVDKTAAVSPGWIEDVLAIAGRNPDMQILLLAGREICDHVCYRCNHSNIYVFSLPLRRQTLTEVLRILMVMYGRDAGRDAELIRLRTKVSEMSVISRAKCLLIERERMTEEEAHHCLEKRAMDNSLSKREVAEEIVRKYTSE